MPSANQDVLLEKINSLHTLTQSGFERVDERFAQVDKRLEQVETHLNQIETVLNGQGANVGLKGQVNQHEQTLRILRRVTWLLVSAFLTAFVAGAVVLIKP